MPRFYLRALALLVAVVTPAFAQPRLDVVRVDFESLIRAAAASPSQFAVPIAHPVSLTSAGVWSSVNGRAVWRYSVQVPTAVSMSFHATRMTLPADATLTVRGSGSSSRTYRARDLHRGGLWSHIYTGSRLDLTLDVAQSDRSAAVLMIQSLQAGYRSLGGSVHDHPYYRKMKAELAADGNGTCVQNYECSVTPQRDANARATVGLVVGNLYQCTGTMINDVAGDNAPYLLTARHCQTGKLGGGDPGAAATLTVYWDATTACGQMLGTLYDPVVQTQTGATTIVEQQDAWLVELEQSPVVTDAQLAGFDASGAAVQGGYTIHHALGFDKQLTTWNRSAFSAEVPGALGVMYLSDFLEVVNALGVIGPGASGSGLFDQNDRLVGTLSLGTQASDSSGYEMCPATPPPDPNGINGAADFTSLAAVWSSTADTTSTTGSMTLKSVLDPAGTGAVVVPSAAAATMVFTASTYSLAVEQTSVLSWNAPNATQCVPSGGVSGDGWTGTLAATGSANISETTDGFVQYGLVCSLPGGRSVRSFVSVTWGSPSPSLGAMANAVVWAGAAEKITWVSNISPCSITGGALAVQGLPSSGFVTTTQATPGDVTYEVTCSSSPTTSIGQPVTVTYVTPSIEFSGNAADLLLGEDFVLEWSSAADTCAPSGGAPDDGWTSTAFPQYPGGSGPIFHPHITTLGTYTYTLTCSSGSVSLAQSVTIKIENGPPLATLSVDRTSLKYTDSMADAVNLTWTSNLTGCLPMSDPAGGNFNPVHEGTDGSGYVLLPPGSYQLSVICRSYRDSSVSVSSAPITVTVLQPDPPAVTMSASANTIQVGQSFTISWSSTNTLTCTPSATIPDPAFAFIPTTVSGRLMFSPSVPGTYSFDLDCPGLTAQVGDAKGEVIVTVTQAAPAGGSGSGGGGGSGGTGTGGGGGTTNGGSTGSGGGGGALDLRSLGALLAMANLVLYLRRAPFRVCPTSSTLTSRHNLYGTWTRVLVALESIPRPRAMLRTMRHGHYRRHRHDPLQPVPLPTWIVVRDHLNCVVASRNLAPGADLRSALAAERDARLADGWECEDIGPCVAFFFCTRHGLRQLVVVERKRPPPIGERW